MSIRILVASTLLLLSTGTANAWEVKSTGAGDPIRWPDGKVVVDVAMGESTFGITPEMGEGAAILALQHWSAEVADTLILVVSDSEMGSQKIAQDGISAIRWGNEAGPFVDPDALATTYLTYRTTTGQVTEADIVVNAVDYEWTVVGNTHCDQRYDLQNILTHEAGHFFGLSHAKDQVESTMFPSAGFCETSKRDLAVDDKQGISFLYEIELPEGPTSKNLAEIANCSTGGTSGIVVAFLVLVILVSLRRRRPEVVERRIRGLTQRDAMEVLKRERRIGDVRSWMTVGVFALSWLVLGTSNADASTLHYLSPTELGSRADLVVEGKVVSQRSELLGGWPVTISTIEVVACHKKECPKTVQVTQLGGEVGDIGLAVSGVSALPTSAEVVLFLRKERGRLRTIGMSQGVFLSKTLAGNRVLVRDIHSVSLVGQGQATILDSLPYSDFKSVFGIGLQRYSGR